MPTDSSEARALALFQILVNEFDDQPEKVVAKAKQKLRRAKLGTFDETEFERLRKLKAALQREIARSIESAFFRAPVGTFANIDDFDHIRMTEHFAKTFPQFADEMGGIVGFALYAYYLR